jgi:hypothetical protein
MKNQFPSFIRTCEFRKNDLKMEFSKADGEFLEFKMPILTFNQIMGYVFIGVTKVENKYYLYLYAKSKKGCEVGVNPIQIEKDLLIAEYMIKMDEMFKLLINEEYIQITTGEL